MLGKTYLSVETAYEGYIAGTGSGIATVAGNPASRFIYLLDADDMTLLQRVTSLKNGHYIFMGLDHDLEYIVMVRDYKKEYEPFAWDYVKPADDLTLDAQQALWASWQT